MPGKYAYIGYGALGKQIATLLRQTSQEKPEEIFFDDLAHQNALENAFLFDEWKEERFAGYDFFVCLGYKQLEKKAAITNELLRLNRRLAKFIHESCIINPDSQIAQGSIIYQGCNIDQQVKIGESVLLNNSVTISHETVIGRNSFLAPGVVVSGNVNIGEGCFIGAGSIISNGVNIGANVIIGAGTVVTKDIPANVSVIGNPMRILDSKLELR